jgi:hypothetical protein
LRAYGWLTQPQPIAGSGQAPRLGNCDDCPHDFDGDIDILMPLCNQPTP